MMIVADAHIPCIEEYFGHYGELKLIEGRQISAADVRQADILIVRSITKVDEALLKGSKVKYVGSVTAGADHLDTKWFDEVGLLWNVATGFNAPPVADYIVSVIATLPQKPKTAAIIGVGNVGRLVLADLQILGIDTVLCDPVRALQETNFNHVPLEKICDCDLILLHVPLTRSGPFPTYHFIDKAFLARQKAGAVLVNACRGAVIDSTSLLQHGRHLQWCMDVWEQEPYINKDILQAAMIATPHIAGYSMQSKIRGIDMIYRLACERGIIEPLPFMPQFSRDHILTYPDATTWQEVVLGIFDPQVVSQLTKQCLLAPNATHDDFDEMRNQFNYRHEFTATKITADQLQKPDRLLVKKLGIKLL